MKNEKRAAVSLKPSDYQPSKAELKEKHKLEVPGDTIKEQMDTLADAVMQPAKIEYEKS